MRFLAVCRWVIPLIAVSVFIAANAGLLSDVIPPLDLLVHFQVQYAWVLAVCLVCLIIQKRLWWSLFTAAALLIPASRIAPWYIPLSTPAQQEAHDSSKVLSLLCCNVKWTNDDYASTLTLIGSIDADIVVVQEATPAWAMALDALQNSYPYHISHPAAGPRGMVMLSKRPLSQVQQALHPITQHCILSGWIELNHQPVQIIALHPFRPGLTHGARNLESELQLAASLAGGNTERTIFIGDLNTTMWSNTYHRFVETQQLTNLRQGAGIHASWSRLIPWVSAIPIDHCLIGKHLEGVSFERYPIHGSDHDAIYATVRIRP